MKNKYVDLFRAVASYMEVVAEKAMEHDKEKDDLTAYKTAKQMRDDFAALNDNLEKEDYAITKKDIANLVIGANIAAKGIEAKIESEKKVLASYRGDLIPKLNKALNSPEDLEKIFFVEGLTE